MWLFSPAGKMNTLPYFTVDRVYTSYMGILIHELEMTHGAHAPHVCSLLSRSVREKTGKHLLWREGRERSALSHRLFSGSPLSFTITFTVTHVCRGLKRLIYQKNTSYYLDAERFGILACSTAQGRRRGAYSTEVMASLR